MTVFNGSGYKIHCCFALILAVFFSQAVVAACGDKATLISRIQGNAEKSPLVNETHTIEAVVVGVFQGNDELNGFFVQEETEHQDNDPLSSEGLFVYHQKTKLKPGQIVRLRGKVQERFGQTQLSKVEQVLLCNTNTELLSKPLDIELPFANDAALEALEGMLVRIKGELIVTDNRDLGRFGQFVVSHKRRLFSATQKVSPGDKAKEYKKFNSLNQLIIDDGNTDSHPNKIVYPAPGLSALNTLRIGQKVGAMVGVLSFAYGHYRVYPINLIDFKGQGFKHKSKRPSSPKPNKPQQVRVAAFNVNNYFNGDGQGGGFPTSRGADSYIEFKRQSMKLGRALAGLDASIVGIAELENDGYEEGSAIASLVSAANTYAKHKYTYVVASRTKLGTDAITVGLLYQASVVTPIGDPFTTPEPPFNELGRPPLAQMFSVLGSKMQITVVMNHFKSKNCKGATDSNKDQGDGQACFNAFRTTQAKTLSNWITRIAPSPSVIILGDLNSYAQEDPIKVLLGAGYDFAYQDQKPLINQAQANNQDYYSFVYQGQAGVLDYVFYHRSLKPYVRMLKYWHINADEPRVLDYHSENKTDDQFIDLFNDAPYRSSDHDPVYLILEFKQKK